MPVVTVWPCQTTLRGRPRFRETIFILEGIPADDVVGPVDYLRQSIDARV